LQLVIVLGCKAANFFIIKNKKPPLEKGGFKTNI
jgi:hypothetical protein